MCGIVGLWDKSKTISEPLIEGMAALLHHRGPEDFGFYKDSKSEIYLGHARLSIIDLEGGHQPLKSSHNKNVLVANGEFYDYQKIRTQLICQGYEFKTKSDSEIALPLYDRYGLEFVHHLRGEFAFSLYDEKNKRLILVRDRFGIRPLFYHLDSEGSFYFASEIKALMGHPKVARAFSPKTLIHQMIQTMVPGSTAFENIFAVKPGHMLIVEEKSGSLEIIEKQYWDADFPEETYYQEAQNNDHYIQQVQEKLIEAVKCRLVADVPVGCYLSGGIDSCSILGLANAFEQKSLRAYTISFDHDDYDELSIAKEMAKKTQAEQVVLKLSSDELYGKNYIDTLWHAERTFYNTLGVAKKHMSHRVHLNHDKVVITGEGSDELFAGYPAFKLDFALHDPQGYGKSAKDVIEKNKLFVGHILSEEAIAHPAFKELCGFTPAWIQPWMMTLKASEALFHQDTKSFLKAYDPFEKIAHNISKKALKDRHPLDCVQYTWIKTMLECQILNWGGDRVDMANSMESRPAFLDHHLAEFAFKIPPATRIHNGVEKWVLREAMKGILPEVLYKRQKFAFMAPPAYTDPEKQKMIYQLKEEFISSEKTTSLGFFDDQALNNFFENCFDQAKGPLATRSDILINHILGIYILKHLFIDNDIPLLAQQQRKILVKRQLLSKGNQWIHS